MPRLSCVMLLSGLLGLIIAASAACADDSSAPELELAEIPPPPPLQWLDSAEVDIVRADVTFRGSTVRYVGHLGRAGVDHLFHSIEEHDEELDTLEVASVAGTPKHARRLGDWVAEQAVTVVVEEICYSECASFVFVAAPRKVIRDHGLVAWDGAWGEAEHLAKRYRMSVEEYIEAQIDAWMAEDDLGLDPGSATAEAIRERRRDLAMGLVGSDEELLPWLERFGVEIEALLYGKLPQHTLAYQEHEANGWTFSTDDMKKLGIDNVSYEGDGSYPSRVALARTHALLFDVE